MLSRIESGATSTATLAAPAASAEPPPAAGPHWRIAARPQPASGLHTGLASVMAILAWVQDGGTGQQAEQDELLGVYRRW